MATQMITLKLDGEFLKDIDEVVRKGSYHNRTEFIRNALREKVDEAKLKDAMMRISHLKGASKKKVTEEEYERVREEVFEKPSKEDLINDLRDMAVDGKKRLQKKGLTEGALRAN